MVFEVIFSSESQSDVQEAYDYYELQKEGLGKVFYDSILQHIDKISIFPFLYPNFKSYKKIKYQVVKKFPFIIYYRIIRKKKQVKILAIFHTSRNPKAMQNRL